MSDKSIRVDPEAAELVSTLATEREVTKASAGSALIRAGYQALTTPPEDTEARDTIARSLASMMALDYVDKNGNRYSVPEYAAEQGLEPYDAVCRLIRVALGREGALAREKAKRPPKAPRAPKPAPEPVLMPWELPKVGVEQ